MPDGGGSGLTGAKVLGLLGAMAMALLLVSLVMDASRGEAVPTWISEVLVNLGSGIVGSCVTFALIDLRLNRQAARHLESERQRERALDQARAADARLLSLITRIRAGSESDMRAAMEELRISGSLDDGSLSGANFSGARLRGVHLEGAVLRSVDLRGADLREADLTAADLSGADLSSADLRGAVLHGTVLEEARTDGARF